MKKVIKAVAVLALALIVCMSFVSCGKKLSGKYEADIVIAKVQLEFSGNKVTLKPSVFGVAGHEIEGTYEIDDDKITLTYGDEDKDAAEEYDLSGTFDFEEGDDYIKIGLVKYKAVK